MSFIGAIGTAIGTVISAVGSWIAETALPAVGSMVAGAAQKIVECVGKIGDSGMFDMIGNIISTVCGILGVQTGENAEILGLKALQAAEMGTSLSDFDDDTIAYINYLNNEIKLDEKKLEEMSETEKLGCKVTGIALETKAVGEKVGVDIPGEFVVTLAQINHILDARGIVNMFTGLKEAGITDMKNVDDYLKGEGGAYGIAVGRALRAAIDDMGMNKETGQIVEEMKQAVRNEAD